MPATVAGIHLSGSHTALPAANTVPDGSLYSCSTHNKIYKSTYATATWADWTVAFGGAYTDPTIPIGGTLYDGSSTAGWTSFGSPDVFDANATIANHLYLQKTTMGTGNLVGAYRATSAFPRTYTMRLDDMYFGLNYHGAGLIFGEAAPGKFWSWFITHDSANTVTRLFQRYAWTTAASAGTNANFNTTTNNFPDLPHWLRIVVNSSTDVQLWQSYQGYIYYQLAAAQNPGFTIGSFGFAMATFAAIEMKAAFKWIHES